MPRGAEKDGCGMLQWRAKRLGGSAWWSNRRGLTRRQRRRHDRCYPAAPVTIEPLEPRVLLASTFELSSLLAVQGGDGYNGSVIYGVDGDDYAGNAVGAAGDINGDGFEDFVIGADGANPDGSTGYAEGASYIVFGQSGQFSPELSLSSLDGTNGFAIPGLNDGDFSGNPVAGAGDVNGDGFDDLIIGAVGADTTTNQYAGAAYVVFGKATDFSPSLDLSSLNGQNGFAIHGLNAYGYAGYAVSTAGDINGDGFDDVLIGAAEVDSDASGYAEGAAYAVFGRATGFLPNLNLSSLNGANGFVVHGIDDGDRLGNAVGTVGDINGDGFDDLVIGARYADGLDNLVGNSGESYVIFGKNETFLSSFDLSSLNGVNGFVIRGAKVDDRSGHAVATAGDVDGDGFDDLLIGARYADGAGSSAGAAGESYVIFGTEEVFTTGLELLSLNGIKGFVIRGIEDGDMLGMAVSTAGDVNGDGLDDLLVGAYGADGSDTVRAEAGESYLIFGDANRFSASLNLGAMNPSLLGDTEAWVFYGIDASDGSGVAVSTAGDVNGDGFDDLLLGAGSGDGVGNLAPGSGESYLVLGGDFTASVTEVGDAQNNVLVGTTLPESLIGAQGDDTLLGNGGVDVLKGGQGDDVLTITDTSFQRLVGGRGLDTLRLDGSDIALDLLSIADNRVSGVERIDIRGSGSNSLAVDLLEVFGLSNESNTVTVVADVDDTVNIGSGWTPMGTEIIEGHLFDVFVQDAAVLNVSNTAAGYVMAHHIFYSGSSFDGDPSMVGEGDDAAIASDKVALSTPGDTAGFANYTSNSRGINGLMIDVVNLTVDGTLGLVDLEFRVGNDNFPGDWPFAVLPSSVTVRSGQGGGGI